MLLRHIPEEEYPRDCEAFAGPAAIYVVQERKRGPVKIGRASHPARRLVALQCGNHRRLKIILMFQGDRSVCIQCEKAIHEKFSEKRVLNEWFKVDPAEIVEVVRQFNDKGAV